MNRDYRVRCPRNNSTMTSPNTRKVWEQPGHAVYPERSLEKRIRVGQTDIHLMNCHSNVYSVAQIDGGTVTQTVITRTGVWEGMTVLSYGIAFA
jgi:hypothetical protein